MSDWGKGAIRLSLNLSSLVFIWKFNLFRLKSSISKHKREVWGWCSHAPCTHRKISLKKLNSLFSQDRCRQSITSLWVTFPVLPSINQQHRLFFPRKSQNILLVSPQPRVSFPWLRILAARIISNHPVTLSRMERMITSRIKHNKILMIITETEKRTPRLFPILSVTITFSFIIKLRFWSL